MGVVEPFELTFDKVVLTSGSYKDHLEVIELASRGFKSVMQSEAGKFLSKLNSEINQYYLNLNEAEQFTFHTNIPNKDWFFKNEEETPAKNLPNGQVYYISSMLNEVDTISTPKDTPKTPNAQNPKVSAIWDSFNESEGNFQMFIGYSNLESIMAGITSKNQFTFNINDDDIPEHIDFTMNVEALGKVYPGNINMSLILLII